MTKTSEQLMAVRFGGASVAADAHAWLDAAGVEVTGYPKAGNFAAIACVV
jgi:hypothetical protein